MLSGLGGVLLNAETVERMLALVADLAHRTVLGAMAVSVTLPHPDGPFTPNATDALARELDEAQYAARSWSLPGGDREPSTPSRHRSPTLPTAGPSSPPWRERHDIGGVYSTPLRGQRPPARRAERLPHVR